ncbi:MAG: hypothetical protein H0X34_00750 [Chthoniobacterales bacterium]|nr:hypothetical protein [Chthoniobacterales bacterium]
METAGQQNWFLRKHVDGSVFGPLPFEQMRRWADGAQIAPHDQISHDQETWLKAPMFPELEMDWLVEVTREHYYGPTTLGAIQEFLRLGEIGEANFIINSCNGSRRQIKGLPELAREPNEPFDVSDHAPPPSPMAINLRDRIDDLEQSLFEERRALEECEARYRDLEAQYLELQKQS